MTIFGADGAVTCDGRVGVRVRNEGFVLDRRAVTGAFEPFLIGGVAGGHDLSVRGKGAWVRFRVRIHNCQWKEEQMHRS